MGLFIGFILILIGIFFKLGVFPFHSWIGDTYQGALLIVVAFFIFLPKMIGIIALVKGYVLVLPMYKSILGPIFYFVGLSSIVFGTILSLYQYNIRRLLAYGSIAHIGFVLLCISIFSVEGVKAGLLYLIVYGVVCLGLFAVLIKYKEKTGKELVHLTEVVKMFDSNYYLAIMFCCFLLAFTGVPPFCIFFGKAHIIYMLIINGNYFTAVLVSLSSVLSSVYYIRVLRFIFFVPIKSIRFIKEANKISYFLHFIIIILFLINLFFFGFYDSIIVFLDYELIEL